MNWFRRRPKWPVVKFEEIRKRAKILVVDDADFPYKELFQRDGYSIDIWHDIADLSKLESGFFDVILLDLQGVGAKDSAEQGLGVLKHLKSVRPAQIVIAFSNADWPLKYQPFFRSADAALDKSADYVDFKRQVDLFLIKRFSLEFYVERALSLAETAGVKSAELRDRVEEAILGRDVSSVERAMAKFSNGAPVAEKILDVVKVGISALEIARTFST